MCARQLTQAHRNQRTSQQCSWNYSPEVETEKPVKRKSKENDLDGKVLCVFWWDRHCRVAHRQNRVVRKFAHAHMAILVSSYSDDVIAFEVKKIGKVLSRFLEFPSVKFLKIWQRSYSLLAFLAFNFQKSCMTRFSLSQKTKKLPWQPLLFSILKISSCQTLPGLSISENFTEGNWRNLKSKPNRRQKMAMFD